MLNISFRKPVAKGKLCCISRCESCKGFDSGETYKIYACYPQVQGYQELYHELLKDNPDLDKVKAENQDLLLYIAKTPVEKDVRKCIHSFVVDILQNKDVKRIEELSEITQNFYHVFGKRLENSTKYAGFDPSDNIFTCIYLEEEFRFHPLHYYRHIFRY